MEKKYRQMVEISHEDYLKFVENNPSVLIEDVEIKLEKHWEVKSLGPPEDYRLEDSTVWSFPSRGNWATHKSNYRGNWSP
ncbi:MAG: DNA methylase, partial [Aquificaceae bacterium]